MPALDLGRRIRQVRRQLGLTQAEFGQRLGIINVSVARYEAGRVSHAEVLRRIAALAGVTVDWLLHGERGKLAVGPPETGRASVSRSLVMPSISLESLLQPSRVTHLPPRFRNRYLRRAKEVLERARRELEEYTRVLE